MTTDNQGGEAAIVETTNTPPAEAGSSSPENDSGVDFEAEARKMGWVPEEEFKGEKRPAKFLSAEEYYRRGEEIIPIIRARNKDLEKRLDDAEATNKRMAAMFEKTLERERAAAKKEIEDLKAERKAAIKAGDDAKAEAIDERIDSLKEEARPGGDVSDNPPAGSEAHTALVRDFAKANPWFVEEPEMQDYAVRFSENNAALQGDISFAENMKATLAAVRKKFPSYFKETTAANGHAAVDAGGDFPGTPPPKGLASKLNATELAQAKKDVQSGLYKTTEEWAKAYYS